MIIKKITVIILLILFVVKEINSASIEKFLIWEEEKTNMYVNNMGIALAKGKENFK